MGPTHQTYRWPIRGYQFAPPPDLPVFPGCQYLRTLLAVELLRFRLILGLRRGLLRGFDLILLRDNYALSCSFRVHGWIAGSRRGRHHSFHRHERLGCHPGIIRRYWRAFDFRFQFSFWHWRIQSRVLNRQGIGLTVTFGRGFRRDRRVYLLLGRRLSLGLLR